MALNSIHTRLNYHCHLYVSDRYISGVNGTWQQKGIDIGGEATNDRSGYSVSLNGDGTTVAIGAPQNSDGDSRIFEFDGSYWAQKGSEIAGDASGDRSGESVALSEDGNVVAIGSPNWGDTGHMAAGVVRIYEYDESTWRQRGSDIDGEAAWDESGRSVSLSSDGDVVAISAYGASLTGGRGVVRIYGYDHDRSTWQQKGSGTVAGYSVSLSDDGDVIAIGSIKNTPTGDVRIYKYDASESEWQQRGSDINGDANSEMAARFAISVSLSSDGDIIAIGGWMHDANVGHVRVYKYVCVIYCILIDICVCFVIFYINLKEYLFCFVTTVYYSDYFSINLFEF